MTLTAADDAARVCPHGYGKTCPYCDVALLHAEIKRLRERIADLERLVRELTTNA